MNAALGIDTSNYVSSCALVGEDGRIIASGRKTLPVGRGKSGLRQSEALFEHVRQFPAVLTDVMSRSRGTRIAALAVSDRPSDAEGSYMPVFLAGTAFAEVLSSTLAVPCLHTSHQRGHIAAAAAEHPSLACPYLCVHLSGGTTEVLLLGEDGTLSVLASSLDLHAGQLVDRLGVLLGGPFPAGPFLEALAADTAAKGRYPVRVTRKGCHFSGVEAQASRDVQNKTLRGEEVAAEVFDALCRAVLKMLLFASEATGLRDSLIMGGVASSSLLRKMLLRRNDKRRLGLNLLFGQPELSGDNAVGVALLGAKRFLCAEAAVRDALRGPIGRAGCGGTI